MRDLERPPIKMAQSGLAPDRASRWFGVGVPVYGCVDATAYRGLTVTVVVGRSVEKIPNPTRKFGEWRAACPRF